MYMFRGALLATAALAIACTHASAHASGSQTKPHIVFLLVDDLGWLDVGFHNGSNVNTPVMTSLASQGVHFDNYYGHSICTPSRASLMTSRFASHTGLQHSYMFQGANYSLPLHFKTLADHLNETAGYSCHAVGKWHLGFATRDMTPTARGFSSHLGYLGGGEDYYTHATNGYLDLTDGDTCAPQFVGQYSTTVFMQRAVEVVQQRGQINDSKPLFLYLAMQSVHAPIEAPPEGVAGYDWINNTNRRTMAGMATDLDVQLGYLVSVLREQNMWQNTVLVVAADNGGPPYVANSNWPMRGGKWTMWEGGTHLSAFVVHGGGLLPAKSFSGLAHHVDWGPTLLAAAGYNYSAIDHVEPRADGVNLWAALLDPKETRGPRDHVLLNVDQTNQEAENDPQGWSGYAGLVFRNATSHLKLVLGNPGVPDGWCWPPQPRYSEDSEANEAYAIHVNLLDPMPNTTSCSDDLRVPADKTSPILFDLAADPREVTNLASEQPETVKELRALLDVYISSAVPPLNMFADQRKTVPAAEARAKQEGCWGPWR